MGIRVRAAKKNESKMVYLGKVLSVWLAGWLANLINNSYVCAARSSEHKIDKTNKQTSK
jgi:hypothetical protein